jgi:Predicted Zn-dependent protease
MINWYWIYRDFIISYDYSIIQDNWIESFKKMYLEPNSAILEEIYFKPKGFESKEKILKRIEEMGFEFFSELRKSIGNINDFEYMIQSTANDILKEFNQVVIDTNVYVIIGGNCTNIYSTEYDGRTITVICLESIQGEIEKIKLLLSHEIHHWIREKKVKDGLFGVCNGERAVTEGLAINCSEFLFPGYRACEYCYVSDSTMNWVIEHWVEVDRLFLEQAKQNDLTSGFFTRNKTPNLIRDIPPRIGYAYGYLKVKNYIRNEGGTPIKLVGVPWTRAFQV